jgi:hypothetical protein
MAIRAESPLTRGDRTLLVLVNTSQVKARDTTGSIQQVDSRSMVVPEVDRVKVLSKLIKR